MLSFMGTGFMLNSDAAKKLYREAAENMPIIDYHCHIDPKEIYEDKRYPNIAQLWLGVGGTNFGDHYKWRIMRAFGVEEDYITGNAPDEERFVQWVKCMSRTVGNPLYHWCHMELRTYFGIDEPLNDQNARRIYRACSERLKDADMSVRGIIRQSNVRVICTTDDPADSLIWHKKLRDDPTFDTLVLPAWRPDKAKDLSSEAYPDYLKRLSEAAGMEIDSYADLKRALCLRMDFFAEVGCVVTDHALEAVPCCPAESEVIERIFSARLNGQVPTPEELAKFHTAFMTDMAVEYARRGWVMQIHFGCRRNNNSRRFAEVGPDTGYDCIGDAMSAGQLAAFLDLLDSRKSLPKTILYSLNPNDNPIIDSVIGCFQSEGIRGKLQHGSAWWFNDHYCGIREQLMSLANIGTLATFVGMLTDSRNFLSYVRHDYFRRILCDLLGEWVEKSMLSADWDVLKEIVRDISYNNAAAYFGFDRMIEEKQKQSANV